MTKARNIADLLDANGIVDNAKITLDANEIPNLDASKIVSGDIASARLGNVPASDDASALTTGTLPSARLGTVTGFTSTGIDDNATSTAITIDSSENVGIGETSLATLTGSASPGLIIKSDAPFIALKDGNNSNKTAYITNSGGILKFGRVDDDLSSNQVQAMQVDNEGNVSIGTTASEHNLNVQANGETTDSWFRNGLTLSCSGSWGGGKQIQVDWDIAHSQSYILEFITASYGARQHFVVGSYYAGSSHQTVMTNNGNSSNSMTQGGNSGGERWTSSGGTHGVYCIRITTANGHHNALVTLI